MSFNHANISWKMLSFFVGFVLWVAHACTISASKPVNSKSTFLIVSLRFLGFHFLFVNMFRSQRSANVFLFISYSLCSIISFLVEADGV